MRASCDSASRRRPRALRKSRKGKTNLYDAALVHDHRAAGRRQDDGARQLRPEFSAAQKFGKEALRGVGARATATGGSRTRRSCSTPPAATPLRIPTQSTMRPAGSASSTLLSKYRTRRPINGVLVAMSLSDLATPVRGGAVCAMSPPSASGSRAAQRVRLATCRSICILTKADLLAGFIEFFDDLGKRTATRSGARPSRSTLAIRDGAEARREFDDCCSSD